MKTHFSHYIDKTNIFLHNYPKGLLFLVEFKLVSHNTECSLSKRSAVRSTVFWVNIVVLVTHPPTAYSLLPMAATPTRARRVDMDATMCQRSVLVSYASQSPWMAKRLPPPVETVLSWGKKKKKKWTNTPVQYKTQSLSSLRWQHKKYCTN